MKRRGAPFEVGLGARASGRPRAFGAGPTERLALFRNTDAGAANPGGAPTDPSVASSGEVVLLTGNAFLAFSENGGRSFTYLDPTTVFPDNPDGGFCCDQLLQYDPKVDRFFWISQYWCANLPGATGASCGSGTTRENRYRIAMSSPAELAASDGRGWTYVDVTTRAVGRPGDWMDYPELALGENSLYLVANVLGAGNRGSVWMRLSTSRLANAKGGDAGVPFSYVFVADVPNRRSRDFGDGFMTRPVHNSGERGYLVRTLGDLSRLRIRTWLEASNLAVAQDVPIRTVPTANCSSLQPSEGAPPVAADWLQDGCAGNRPPGPTTVGGTASRGKLWLPWAAGRRYPSDTKDRFPQPHIELAVIDTATLKLDRQEYLWHPDYAFAYPALAANRAGEVAMSFMWGGNSKYYASHAVALLTGRRHAVATASSQRSSPEGRYGDYLAVRPHHPNNRLFSAAGYTVRSSGAYHPRYALFGREGDMVPEAPRGTPPDLVITDLRNNNFTVANVGGSSAGPFVVRLTHPDAGVVQDVAISGLPPGTYETRTFNCYGGRLVATADADAQVAERDEGNNTRELQVKGCIS